MFKRFPVISSVFDENEKNENINYWLQKLYKQEEEKKPPFSDSRLYPRLAETEKTLEEKGKNENTKNHATKVEEDRESMDQLVKSSNRCIMSISSSLPWDFFPNTINIEESRVTFVFRQFLASQSHSVDIKDISNVFIESSFLFSSLQIVSRTFVQNDIKIGYLSKKKAIKARMVIEGLRMLAGHNLNTSSYGVDELISKIEEMHTSQGGQIN